MEANLLLHTRHPLQVQQSAIAHFQTGAPSLPPSELTVVAYRLELAFTAAFFAGTFHAILLERIRFL